jgi:hypothetical protein
LRKVLLTVPTLPDRPDFAERPGRRAIVTGNRRKTDMRPPEKEGVMTPEIWQELCGLNALPPDQREAAFLEAAPQLGVKPGTVVPRWHWDFDECYKRMLNEAATGLR